jgi:hypothetical protein
MSDSVSEQDLPGIGRRFVPSRLLAQGATR